MVRDQARQRFPRPWRQIHQEFVDAGAFFYTDEDWADHVDHATKLVGEDYVGIGLDMGEAGFEQPRDWEATNAYLRITEALVARGYSPARVRKILGENWLRVLDRAKVVTAEPSATR